MTIQVFGITGTNGKTTVSYILRNILEAKGEGCGLIGTIEHQIGNKNYTPINTTPGAELLKEFFKEMEQQGIPNCVMEVSSHGIAQERIKAIDIAYAGFTNLSQDHLDYHKTMEAYYQAKKKLFEKCSVGAAVNIDDAYGRRLYKELLEERPDIATRGYSLKNTEGSFFGEIEEESLAGSKVIIKEEKKSLGKVKISIPGRHFVYNSLQAISLARMAGIDFSAIKLGVEGVSAIPGRMEKIGSEDDTLGIVDYAHTPDGLKKLLTTVSAFKKGRLICVFGCGGFRDKGKRQMMGDIAGTYSDYCIITNDNPRGEPPENISQAIEEGIYPTGCEYCTILDRYQAIKRAVTLATKWDIIVVAGKGHETYQLLGDEKVPFDDRKTLRDLLEKKYETTYHKTD